jgi:DNA-binding response OmpR family regulator
MGDASPVVLVVDDETDLADSDASLLGDDYDVRVAYGGEAGLQADDKSVAVVLLDRRMPGFSGEEVVERIRERPGQALVAMVTAIDPDFDVVGMGFDDYVTKPVTREELVATVESLRLRGSYREEVRRYFSLVTKRAALESETTEAEPADSDSYTELLDEIDRLETELDDLLDDLTMDDYVAMLRDIQPEGADDG